MNTCWQKFKMTGSYTDATTSAKCAQTVCVGHAETGEAAVMVLQERRPSSEAIELRASLIAEALNIHEQTGLTPAQLQTRVAELEGALAAEREACAVICDEMAEHWAAYKDSALLNGDVVLSNAASGEPRAALALAALIRGRNA